MLVLKIVCIEITEMPVIQRGCANARLHSQRESELCTGWQRLLLVARGFSCWQSLVWRVTYPASSWPALQQVWEREEGERGGGEKVAALAEDSKHFGPFFVMVENVRIDCIRDLPVSLTHLLCRSSSLPSSLSDGLGFVLLMLHCFSSTGTASPRLYNRHTRVTQWGVRVLAVYVLVVLIIVIVGVINPMIALPCYSLVLFIICFSFCVYAWPFFPFHLHEFVESSS